MLRTRGLGASLATLLVFTVLLVVDAQTRSAQAATAERILITGDSITQGSAGDYTWRYRLWKKLGQTASGSVSFVGPRTDLFNNVDGTFGFNAYATPFSGDAHGAKWGGTFALDGSGITSMVNASNPTILVEMLGSNDLAYQTNPDQTIANLRTYITRARAAKPGIDIVVGKVLTRYDFWTNNYTLSSETSEYASKLVALAAELNNSSERVVVANTSSGWDPKTMTWDGTHPNPTGEALIAQRVSEALAALGVGASSPNIATNIDWGVSGPKPTITAGIEEAQLSWQRTSTGANGMFIWQRLVTLDPNQPWEKLPFPVGADGWKAEGLAANGKYEYRLEPAKGLMNGLAGAANSVTVGSKPVGDIPSLSVTPRKAADGASIADAEWSAATNATDYQLASANVSRSEGYISAPYGITGRNWTFAYLHSGNKYRFRITPNRGFAPGSPKISSLERMKGLTDNRAYAILGDSYSAGLGSENPQESGPCLRSTGGWGNQLQANLVSARALIACSGKTTAHVRAIQIDQMKAFFNANANLPKLVTMTIGGNDLGFSDIAKSCAVGDCSGDEGALSDKIDSLESTLKATYSDLKAAAPTADILVGGYPGLFQVNGISNNPLCNRVVANERMMTNRLVARLNSRIGSASRSAGIWNVEQAIYNEFGGHNACNGLNEWIHELNFDAGGELNGVFDAKTLHPNPGGQYWYSMIFGAVLMNYAD